MVTSRLIIMLTLLLILNVGCANENKVSKKTKEDPIEQPKVDFKAEELLNSWVSMWNTYDLSLVDKLFLTNSKATYLSSEKEGLIKGINAVRNHHEGFGFVKGGKVQENKLWLEDIQTEVFWPVAVVKGIWFFRRGPEDSGKIQRGPVTFVYVQSGNEYRIAHVHFSNY